MQSLFMILIVTVMLSRWFLIQKEQRGIVKRYIIPIFLHIASLFLLRWNLSSLIYVLIQAALVSIPNLLENRIKNRDILNICLFWAQFVIIILFSVSNINLNLHPNVEHFLSGKVSFLAANQTDPIIHWTQLLTGFAGLLFLFNESSLIIKTVINPYNPISQVEKNNSLSPEDSNKKEIEEEKEVNAGHLIGIFERTLIYFFVLAGEYSAIAFILAAKGFTRFKQLEKRPFAEYMLIGTLLSSIIAMFIAVLVNHIHF